jgi:hypothetical protein
MKIVILIILISFITLIAFYLFDSKEEFWTFAKDNIKTVSSSQLKNEYTKISLAKSSITQYNTVDEFAQSCLKTLSVSDKYDEMVIIEDTVKKTYSCYLHKPSVLKYNLEKSKRINNGKDCPNHSPNTVLSNKNGGCYPNCKPGYSQTSDKTACVLIDKPKITSKSQSSLSYVITGVSKKGGKCPANAPDFDTEENLCYPYTCKDGYEANLNGNKCNLTTYKLTSLPKKNGKCPANTSEKNGRCYPLKCEDGYTLHSDKITCKLKEYQLTGLPKKGVNCPNDAPDWDSVVKLCYPLECKDGYKLQNDEITCKLISKVATTKATKSKKAAKR